MAASSNSLNLNSPVIEFTLKGTDNKIHSPADFDDKPLLLITFICNHCPYVKAVIGRLASLHKKHKDNVGFIAINSNDPDAYPEDSFENMIEFQKKHGFTFPYVVDDSQQIAKQYDAQCTPDIYLYNRERTLKYRGQIDDSWKDESKVTSNDLEKAINHLLNNEEIPFKQIPTIGCSIKWREDNV